MDPKDKMPGKEEPQPQPQPAARDLEERRGVIAEYIVDLRAFLGKLRRKFN
jgi:hypothetical protein